MKLINYNKLIKKEMDNYTWQKNKAIVDRMYYSERVFTTSTLFAAAFTATNLLHIKKNYFADIAKARLFPTLKYYLIFNVAIIAIL